MMIGVLVHITPKQISSSQKSKSSSYKDFDIEAGNTIKKQKVLYLHLFSLAEPSNGIRNLIQDEDCACNFYN